MFWSKPLFLTSILAGFAYSAPVINPQSDSKTLETRSTLERRAAPPWVWRHDDRDPNEIAADGGFALMPNNNGWNYDLYRHVLGAYNDRDPRGSGYVSTTSDFNVAARFIENGDVSWIYKIAPGENLISAQDTLGTHNPNPHEKEYSALDGIPMGQIKGWQRCTRGQDGKLVKETYQKNPQYQKSIYGKKNRKFSPPRPDLAGFSRGHVAWGQMPWAQYASCPPGQSQAGPSTGHVKRVNTPKTTQSQTSSTKPNSNSNANTNTKPNTTDPKTKPATDPKTDPKKNTSKCGPKTPTQKTYMAYKKSLNAKGLGMGGAKKVSGGAPVAKPVGGSAGTGTGV